MCIRDRTEGGELVVPRHQSQPPVHRLQSTGRIAEVSPELGGLQPAPGILRVQGHAGLRIMPGLLQAAAVHQGAGVAIVPDPAPGRLRRRFRGGHPLGSFIIAVSYTDLDLYKRQLPHHALYFTNPYLKYWLVFLYVLFAAAFFLRPKARRKYAVAGVLAAVSLAVTVRLGAPHYTRGGLDAYVLDVGQGESVLLTSGGKFALVDCGSRNSWYDAGGIAADHLATMGCGTLDYLIQTHYDCDHSSGVAELLARCV